MNIRLINLAIILQVLLSAVNQYFILSWAIRFTKATSSFEIKLINSCRNTLCPLQNIKKCWSSSFWFCLQTKHLLTSTGMGTPQISYSPVCIGVELEETQFGSLSQSWELLAENRTAVLPRMRGEGRRGVTPYFQFVYVTLPIYDANSHTLVPIC